MTTQPTASRHDSGRLSPAPAPGAAKETAVPVADVSNAIKGVIEQSFAPLWIRGEVTNFTAHRNGHWYFSLRDAEAQLRCVVWSRDAKRFPARPEDGMQLIVRGRIGVYAARTEVQLTVDSIEADGDGLWELALKKTIATLTAEGLINPSRRRAIPSYPACIAVITSADGAAWHDIVSVTRRRFPSVRLVLVPAAVQGEHAVPSLLAALGRVIRWNGCDTVIIGRGGGSREDLWAFNDITLARAVATCPIPIISAVGHEVDVSVTDLVADLRAATPSAAAEAAVPSRQQLADALATRRRHIALTVQQRVRQARERLGQTRDQMVRELRRGMDLRRTRIASLTAQLQALSPLAVLARGYAVPQDGTGATLRTPDAFVVGELFHLRIDGGVVDARTVQTHTPS